MNVEATGLDRKQVRLSLLLSLGNLLAEEGDATLTGLTGEEERHSSGRGETRREVHLIKLRTKTYFV